MKAHLSTDQVNNRNKISLWIDMVCAHLVQVDCRHVAEPERFSGSVSKLALPQLEIAQIRAGGQTVCRTTRHIGHAKDECILVNIQRSGEGLVRQNGRDAILKPGDFAIYSSTRPYELAFERDFEQTVLIFPAQALPQLSDDIDRLSALTISGGREASRLLLRLADALYENAHGVPAETHPLLTQTILQTLLAATAGQSKTDKQPLSLTRYHLARVKAFVSSHLHDPDLSAGKIAAGAGISVSHLHRIFMTEQKGIMEWVWDQRISACKYDLADAGKSHLSINEIAFRWGYNNASHFSRAFRAQCGMTPREWRTQNLLTRV
jgi:AraC-like DNA-binding protein